MRRFVKGWKTGGHEKRLAAKMANCVDDFAICCRGMADEAMAVMRGMMSKLKLTVNETKTRLCQLPDESFDFLGYTLSRHHDCQTGKSYLGSHPSRKKIERLCREIGKMTTRKSAGRAVEVQIGRINRKLRGWTNYFRIGMVSKAYRNVSSRVRHRVHLLLCVKFKVEGNGKKRFCDHHLHQKLGLYRLQQT
jgi:RNA-directed DNA polymerase